MNYAAARGLIRSGDLLAWSHRGWRSWYDVKVQMVRFFTQSEYSHVGVAFVTGGRVFVLEAVQPKVRIYPLSMLGSFYWVARNSELDADRALSKIGCEYSQVEAMAAFFEKTLYPDKCQCAKYATFAMYGTSENTTPSAVVESELMLGKSIVLISAD